jgi:hypothetical protein
MSVKIDLNTIMTGLVLGLVTWIFTTVQRVDKQIALAGYRVDALAASTFDPDCPYCNHALHGQIER